MNRTREIRFRDPNYIEIIRAVRGVVEEGFSEEQKEEEYRGYLAKFKYYSTFPNHLINEGFDELVINRLGYDERFCERAGIDYRNFGNHLIDIALALCRFYDRQLKQQIGNKS